MRKGEILHADFVWCARKGSEEWKEQIDLIQLVRTKRYKRQVPLILDRKQKDKKGLGMDPIIILFCLQSPDWLHGGADSEKKIKEYINSAGPILGRYILVSALHGVMFNVLIDPDSIQKKGGITWCAIRKVS